MQFIQVIMMRISFATVILLIVISTGVIRCETDIDECASSPCVNNATCIDRVNYFECNCTTNYTGNLCDVLISETCAGNPCKNNATCTDQNVTEPGQKSFNCTCPRGYEGVTCDTMENYCKNQPCQNGATCENDYTIYDYKCSCVPGFTGSDCETNIDDCSPDPCNNHGVCNDQINNYTCSCNTGWEGDNCEIDINECTTSNPCLFGTCTNTDGSYTCDCDNTGYRGKNCSEQINECTESPSICKHGSQCYDLAPGYFCNCSEGNPGYSGNNCEVANCSLGACKNGATCTEVPTTANESDLKCDCPLHVRGPYCETVHPCFSGPCAHNAVCVEETDATYRCDCKTGWKGTNCTEDIDECSIRPPICQNDGTCNNLLGSYKCSCVPGFTDANCSTNIDECVNSTCVHGECVDLINKFECNCNGTGFQGSNCEQDIDECLQSPCQRGSTCRNIVGNFTCDCASGTIGRFCSYDDPCVGPKGVCQNGGTCEAIFDSGAYKAVCTCSPNIEGVFCEKTTDPEPLNLAIIIGPVVAGIVLIILIIAVVIFLMMARNKRATRGTYSPSRQEMQGPRVEMGNIMKPPPEERLI